MISVMRATGAFVLSALVAAITPSDGNAQSLACLADALGTIRCADGKQYRPSNIGIARDASGAPVLSILPEIAARIGAGAASPTTGYGLTLQKKTNTLGRRVGYNGLECSGAKSLQNGCE